MVHVSLDTTDLPVEHRFAAWTELATNAHGPHRARPDAGAVPGYADPATFNRAFQRQFGMPPGEYRRRFG